MGDCLEGIALLNLDSNVLRDIYVMASEDNCIRRTRNLYDFWKSTLKENSEFTSKEVNGKRARANR